MGDDAVDTEHQSERHSKSQAHGIKWQKCGWSWHLKNKSNCNCWHPILTSIDERRVLWKFLSWIAAYTMHWRSELCWNRSLSLCFGVIMPQLQCNATFRCNAPCTWNCMEREHMHMHTPRHTDPSQDQFSNPQPSTNKLLIVIERSDVRRHREFVQIQTCLRCIL